MLPEKSQKKPRVNVISAILLLLPQRKMYVCFLFICVIQLVFLCGTLAQIVQISILCCLITKPPEIAQLLIKT